MMYNRLILIVAIIFLLQMPCIGYGSDLVGSKSSSIMPAHIDSSHRIKQVRKPTEPVITITEEQNEDGTFTKTVTTTYFNKDGSIRQKSIESITKGSDGSVLSQSSENISYNYVTIKGKKYLAETVSTKTFIDNSEGTVTQTVTTAYYNKDGTIRQTSIKSITKGSDGSVLSQGTETISYNYVTINGKKYLSEKISTQIYKDVSGDTQTITRNTTYQRDSKGVCTGVSQSATGNRTMVESDGSMHNYVMSDYVAIFKYSAEINDWFLAAEYMTWTG